MAIVQESLTINNKSFVRTYSNSGVKVHGGYPVADYEEVYDPAELGRTYTETEIQVEETEAEELLSILTGGAS